MKPRNFDRSATPLWNVKDLVRRPALEEMFLATITTGIMFVLAVAVVLLFGALVML